MPVSEKASRTDWARPGVETVHEGVHRIALPLPLDALTAVNVYALETGSGLLLIDGGWAVPEGRRQLEESLAELGFTTSDIAMVLVTHIHRDHYTLGAALQREVGCVLSVGRNEADSLAELRVDPRSGAVQISMLAEAGAAALIDGWRGWLQSQPDDSANYADPTDWLSDGESIELGEVRLRAVHTPGHTRGHFVFVDEDRSLLFSGDHLLPTITPSIGFEPVRDRLALRAFLDSLRKVEELGDLALMPAHGPAGMNSKDRARALIEHHEARLQSTFDAIAGEKTAAQAAAALRWTRRGLQLRELEPYNQALAVLETEHHLELLEARGLLRSTLKRSVRRYRRTP